MNKDEWSELLEEEYAAVLGDFYNPLIPARPVLEERLKGSDTAYFDFRTNKTHISRKFLEEICTKGGMDARTAVRGICKHEVGHYTEYPRELSTLLFIAYLAHKNFPKFEDAIVGYWLDIKDNLQQVLNKNRGRDVRALYRGMNRLVEAETTPEQREFSVDRLLTAFYQEQGEEDLGVDIKGTYLEEKLKQLMDLRLTEGHEIFNFIQFGTILSEVLEKMPQQQRGGHGGGAGGGSSPRMGDTPSIGDFRDDQIEKALDDIITKWGKERYESIREFVEKETGKTFDRNEARPKGNVHAGLASSEITINDEHISYYTRKSSTYGLYIHRRPIIVDVLSAYRQGSTRFKASDPFKLLNPFSTGADIMPSITKKYRQKQGTKKDRLFRVPDLSIWIDSSGSMENPVTGSNAVLAAYILARNYWENGSEVGVVNFSTDTAFLYPTRELQDVYSMLTAYWGGGTALNIKKVKEYFETIGKDHPLKAYTTEQDYEEMVKRLPQSQQRGFMEKSIEIDLKGKVAQTYEKIDNVMITDGGIYNLEEVVGYLNQTGKVTRNVIILIGNKGQYEEWAKLNLPNTTIIPVSKSEDLIGLVIGEARNLVPQIEKPRSLFYR